MIQVFFAAQISDEEFLSIFERAAEMMSTELQHYARITRNIEAYSSYTSSPCEFFFWILTLDVGIHILQSNNRQPDDVRLNVSCFALTGACLVWLGLPRRRDAGNHRANQPPNGEQGKIGWIKWLVWIPWVSLIAWLALCGGCHSICWMGSFMIIGRRPKW